MFTFVFCILYAVAQKQSHSFARSGPEFDSRKGGPIPRQHLEQFGILVFLEETVP